MQVGVGVKQREVCYVLPAHGWHPWAGAWMGPSSKSTNRFLPPPQLPLKTSGGCHLAIDAREQSPSHSHWGSQLTLAQGEENDQ